MSNTDFDRQGGGRPRGGRPGKPFGKGGGRGFGGKGGFKGGYKGKAGGPSPKADVGGRYKHLHIDEHTPLAQAFADLGVPERLALGLGSLGILEPFPIQAATIGDALAGKDVLGRGRTGSGKTFAFGLPLMARLMDGKTESRHPRGLILTPTRELAMQVYDALAPLAQLVGLHLSIVIGGAKYERQIDSLARGADIVVATPGRLEDLIKREACDLSKVEIAVLDEADQMADMGFLPIVDELLQQIPRGGQRLLFSATLDRGVDAIVKAHLNKPVEHATEPEGETVETMDHHVFVVQPRDKYPVIRTVATRKGRTIAFVRTQRGADDLAEELIALGISADVLHGGKTQAARNKALKNLKDGTVNVLVATDVAARGIHVDGIDLVLNVDLPRDFKDYLHRAGRTARAGASGLVVSVASVKQTRLAHNLMDQAGIEAKFHRVAATDDVLSELTGATEVKAKRPGWDSAPAGDGFESRSDDQPPRRPREHRPLREERPRKPRVFDRPRFEDDRRSDDRPRFDRDRRSDDRPRFDRDRRSDDRRSDDRPRFDRDRRSDERRSDDRPRSPKPRADRREDSSAGPNRAARRAHLQPGAKAGKPVKPGKKVKAETPKSKRKGKPRSKVKRSWG